MGKGGIGSASIVLVFAVLCLTIFSVISLLPALTNQRLINNEVQTVKDFYAADTLAERILAELLASDEIPDGIMGVELQSYWCWDTFLMMVEYAVPVSDKQILHVEVGIDFDEYIIYEWRLMNESDWQADDSINIWTGEFDFSEW